MRALEELISIISEYMDSLSNFPVYLIGFIIVTILLAAIFTKHRWIKFIPSLVSIIFSIFIGLDAWEHFTNSEALDQAWQAIILLVSGIVSFSLALILHMYISKKDKKKKTKKIEEE